LYGVKGRDVQDKSEQVGSARLWKKSKTQGRCGKKFKKLKLWEN
jgi:hypothetical protein